MIAGGDGFIDSFGSSAPTAHPGTYPFNQQTIVEYRDGVKLTVMFGVRNTGRTSIEVLAPEPLDGNALAFDGAFHLTGGYASQCCLLDEHAPIRFPMHVAPGHEVQLAFRYRLTNCETYGKGDFTGYDAAFWRVRVLGVHHTVRVPMGPFAIRYPGAGTAACKATPPSQL